MKTKIRIETQIKKTYENKCFNKYVLAQMPRLVEVHDESTRKHASLKLRRVPNRFRGPQYQRVFAFRREAVLQEPVLSQLLWYVLGEMEFRYVLVDCTTIRGFKRNVVPQYCSIELISDAKASLATHIYPKQRAKCRHASDLQRHNRSQCLLTKKRKNGMTSSVSEALRYNVFFFEKSLSLLTEMMSFKLFL